MPDSIRIKEIHQALNASKYSFYQDSNNNLEPSEFSLGWTIFKIAKALGLSFNLAGELQSVRQRKNVPWINNAVTIPSGWERGQFATNTGDDEKPHDPFDHSRQNGGLKNDEKDRLGIAYQQKCNKYAKYDQNAPENSEISRGDVVLNENIPQLLESFWEDLDKALNMRDLGTGVLPSADGTQYCTFEGLGALVAENAFMLSSLSNNLYQIHNLCIANNHLLLQVLKGLGLPVNNEIFKIKTGELDEFKQEIIAKMPLPSIAGDALNLTQQNFTILSNIAQLLGQNSEVTRDLQNQ